MSCQKSAARSHVASSPGAVSIGCQSSARVFHAAMSCGSFNSTEISSSMAHPDVLHTPYGPRHLLPVKSASPQNGHGFRLSIIIHHSVRIGAERIGHRPGRISLAASPILSWLHRYVPATRRSMTSWTSSHDSVPASRTGAFPSSCGCGDVSHSMTSSSV